MLDSNTVVWCGLAAHGAAWCDVGRRAAAGVHGRARSGMRMCDSASGSARRAGVRTYFIIIILIIIIIVFYYHHHHYHFICVLSTKQPLCTFGNWRQTVE